RFIATQECVDAHEKYKKALLDADENATVVIKRSLGPPARALKNQWTDEILEREKQYGDYESLKTHISGEANKQYIYKGEETAGFGCAGQGAARIRSILETAGFGWAGQGAARIRSIPTVEELIQSMIDEAADIRRKWS